MSTQAIIRSFITDELLLGDQQIKFGPDDDLIGKGVLDSLALMRLILFLEEKFGVAIADKEMIPGNFLTLNRIQAFVELKQAAVTTAGAD